MNHFETLLIGRSPELSAQLRAAALVAATDVPLLIQGESGTGKDLLAHAVHQESPRAAGPLITVNCAALPETLAESLLYGHKRGAFTGAVADQSGQVVEAHGGTLFLDEIGELPLGVQAKLLRFLESGECLPIGSKEVITADVRLIAATNRDLLAEVQAGRFREDLYYRLNVVPIVLPPLRERNGDLLLLLDFFTTTLAEQYRLEPPRYTRAARQRLCEYHWPGNVRELRNLCERMLILFSGSEIDADNLPNEIRSGRPGAAEDNLIRLPAEGLRLEDVEVQLIRQALEQSRGNRSHAARLLGLSRDTLLYRLKKYAIEV
ncbi:sigma-54 dependent transcriptional regulator [Thiohalobacter sp. IOR34]|uniref:sigma-54 interaction domain-containing protein n=1 Tax=Thiohalobacter sp. IOR34 TaxID=3057176 RepID=UPI0025AED020|nr:sigma-54 dependent transcriptional regulator [Thiohalobacter sp. IOR34]WJW75454.1 sigma-54 dependent transcriptional regulator [Thiohalobacter sp. IOR34]